MTESDAPVLSVKHLRKTIGGKDIIKDVSFEIRKGEVFGFLGPNGAGKTTTIRMLVDLIRPSSGTVTIHGNDLRKHRNQALQHIGCIVENPELYPYLTGWENLGHFAAMLRGTTTERIREVVELVGMERRIHDKVKTYSLGMKQRLGIAQALLGKPKLLILDEPTNGLDPQGIREMRAFIRTLAEQGLSLMISSHLLSEVQMMCDRVAIIRKGEVISVGKVQDLLARPVERVHWSIEPLADGLHILNDAEDVAVLEKEGMTVWTEMPSARIPELNRRLVEAGINVHAVEIKPPTLEEMFLDLTKGENIG